MLLPVSAGLFLFHPESETLETTNLDVFEGFWHVFAELPV